jgi:hypothetical protein
MKVAGKPNKHKNHDPITSRFDLVRRYLDVYWFKNVQLDIGRALAEVR